MKVLGIKSDGKLHKTKKSNKNIKRDVDKKKIILTIVILSLVFLANGFNNSIHIRKYEIESEKISDTVKIAFISDLHSCYYGDNQVKLIDLVEKNKPDLVILGGDVFDDILPSENAEKTIEKLTSKYQCYYVSGNHEYWSNNIDGIKDIIESYKVEILEGECKNIIVNKQHLDICGIDDFEVGEDEYIRQLENAAKNTKNVNYKLLVAHRPEYIDLYKKYGFDLILAGHAHGGQWRIPGIINGVLSPNQGFLPKYAGGIYKYDNANFIVSRGLAKESTRIPRFHNPPELVIIYLKPVSN